LKPFHGYLSFMPGRQLFALLLVLWLGCGERPGSTSSSDPSAANASPSSALDDPSVSAAHDEARMAALLGELTQTARRYGAEQRRVPKTLDELVASGYLERIPAAPPGKRFAINKKLEVYLE
jgi:hypothetical protein